MTKENLEKIDVWKIILFSLITLGVYSFFWLFRTKAHFRKNYSESKIHQEFIYIYSIIWSIAILIYFSIFLLNPLIVNLDINAFGVSSIIISIIFLILTSFEYKRALDTMLRYKGSTTKLSPFFTLVFGIFYLQYEINRIIENKEHKKRKGPIAWALVIFGIILPLFLELTLIQIFMNLSLF